MAHTFGYLLDTICALYFMKYMFHEMYDMYVSETWMQQQMKQQSSSMTVEYIHNLHIYIKRNSNRIYILSIKAVLNFQKMHICHKEL